MSYWVYILASAPRGTLYIGVTRDLVRRVYEHRAEYADGFTRKYGIKTLVDFEEYADAITAIQREKNMKRWSREWKTQLIIRDNPMWRDLYPEIAS